MQVRKVDLKTRRSDKVKFLKAEGESLLEETQKLAPILAQEITTSYLDEYESKKTKFYDTKTPFLRYFNLYIHEPCDQMQIAFNKYKLQTNHNSIIEQWISEKKLSITNRTKPNSRHIESNMNTNWVKYWIDRLCNLTIESIKSQLMIEHPKYTHIEFQKIGHETSSSFSSIQYDKLGCQIAIRMGDILKDPTFEIFDSIVNPNNNNHPIGPDNDQDSTDETDPPKSKSRTLLNIVFPTW